MIIIGRGHFNTIFIHLDVVPIILIAIMAMVIVIVIMAIIGLARRYENTYTSCLRHKH